MSKGKKSTFLWNHFYSWGSIFMDYENFEGDKFAGTCFVSFQQKTKHKFDKHLFL